MNILLNKLFLMIGIVTLLQSQTFKEIGENKISSLFPTHSNLEFKQFVIPDFEKKEIEKKYRQKFFRPSMYSWKIYNNSEAYYCLIDNVMGKVQPITFLIIFSESDVISHLEILKYRESHGYEVKRKTFLDQFINKEANTEFSLNKNVDGISGATISVNNMTKGLNKLSVLFHLIRKNFNDSK